MESTCNVSNDKMLVKELLSVNPSLSQEDIRFCTDSMSLDLSFSRVTELAPVSRYPLRSIDITATRVQSLPKFMDGFLTSADIEGTDIACLSNVSGQNLEHLNARNTAVSSLKPLQGMNLSWLDISSTPVEDLQPLVGMPLRKFFASYTSIRDISPLCKCPLEELYLSGTNIQSLANLSTIGLKTLYIINTPLAPGELDLFRKNSPGTHVYNDVGDLQPSRDNSNLKILLAEDDSSSLHLYAHYLSRLGHDVTPVSTGMELMKKGLLHKFDIILSDIVMPSGYGDDIVQILREKGIETPVILITGFHHTHYAESLGAFVLQKPFELQALASAILQVLNKRELTLQRPS